MSKRRADEDDASDIDVSSTDESDAQVSDDDMEEVIDVDFDYFDLNPQVDFHATKTFLTQLFGDDAINFDISGLADLVLNENVGTTIKTEGKESDPFAILSVINITDNIKTPCVKQVVDYILQKTQPDTQFNMILSKLLTPGADAKKLKVGLVVSERMINMPVEVVPPMYRMLTEEMEKAEDSHEKYEFDWFVVLSKIYKMVGSTVDEDEEQQSKKKKKATKSEEFDYFHYEDLVLEENAKYHRHYAYTNQRQETDSRRVFTEYGIDPRLSLLLLDKKGLAKSVGEMADKFPPF